MMSEIHFVDRYVLYGLIIIPLLGMWYYWKRNKQNASLSVSSTKPFLKKRHFLTTLKPLPFLFRLVAISLFIVGMAKPQKTSVTTRVSSTQGVDIVMAIDLSASMLAEDLKPNRLEALKSVAKSFVENRKTDRIGVVAYAGEGYTQTPVTSDHRIVINSINKLRYGLIDDGTAIGVGLGTAINRLKNSKALSKIIILLTDGVSNVGSIDPRTAAEIAAEQKIKVYTIGIGSNGKARMPVSISREGTLNFAYVPVQIDEKLLKEIAKKTHGKYFRATTTRSLEEIYKEIDKLEKTEYEEFKYYNNEEKYRPWLLFGLFFLALELIMRWTFFKSFI